MVEGSAIRNREHKQQIVDFGGLRWGKIMPTDLDAYIDFGGRFFVFVEAKYGLARLSFGQRLALERLCDACHQPACGINAVAFVCSHSDRTDVDLAKAVVVEYRWQGKWQKPKRNGVSLKSGIDAMKAHVQKQAA